MARLPMEPRLPPHWGGPRTRRATVALASFPVHIETGACCNRHTVSDTMDSTVNPPCRTATHTQPHIHSHSHTHTHTHTATHTHTHTHTHTLHVQVVEFCSLGPGVQESRAQADEQHTEGWDRIHDVASHHRSA